MNSYALRLGISALVLLSASACTKENKSANGVPSAQTDKAQKAAGAKTIAAGLAPTSRFMAAAKATGLDQTLAGPGPYTVFVPDDVAFNGAPAGMFDANPKNRAQTTGVLTNLILPGTVMAADIEKLIERGKGKGILGTVGGGLLTATKEGGKIVLADSAGHKANVTQADEQFSNGVVHHVDAMLLPANSTGAPAAAQKPGP